MMRDMASDRIDVIYKLSKTCNHVSYRKYCYVDIAQFKEDIIKSEMLWEPASSVDELVSQYNCSLKICLMSKSKSDFYNSKITLPKSLFKVADILLHCKSSVLQ